MTNVEIFGTTTIKGLKEISNVLNYYLTSDGMREIRKAKECSLEVRIDGNEVKFYLLIDEYDATIRILD